MSQTINLPPKWKDAFDLTPTGLIWKIPNPSKAHLLAVADHLVGIRSSTQWGWADLLRDAMDLDGTKPCDAYAQVAGLHPEMPEAKTLQNWVITARRWSSDRRRLGRGAYFSHHECLNPLTDAEQNHLLDISQARQLSVRSLRELRYQELPKYGEFKPGTTAQQELADTQAEVDRLQREAFEKAQETEALKDKVLTLESVIEQADLSLPLPEIAAGAELIRRYTDKPLPTGKLVVLSPGASAIVFFVDDRLGSVSRDGYITWYERSELTAWLYWYFVERPLTVEIRPVFDEVVV